MNVWSKLTRPTTTRLETRARDRMEVAGFGEECISRLRPLLPLPRLPAMARMVPPITITADEVNCLIHAYFEDSGK